MTVTLAWFLAGYAAGAVTAAVALFMAVRA